MGLEYRPMVCDTQGTVTAYEAIPWFGGILDRPDEREAMEEADEWADCNGYVDYELIKEDRT